MTEVEKVQKLRKFRGYLLRVLGFQLGMYVGGFITQMVLMALKPQEYEPVAFPYGPNHRWDEDYGPGSQFWEWIWDLHKKRKLDPADLHDFLAEFRKYTKRSAHLILQIRLKMDADRRG